MSKKVLVPISNGIEELECVSIIDVLRRCGVNVTTSSIDQKLVVGANSITIGADEIFDPNRSQSFDAIVLPGGTEGAENFSRCDALVSCLKTFDQQNKLIAAICASPALVFAKHNFLQGKNATCYPSFREHLSNYVDEKVVVSGNIVTSQGPGTALTFALHLGKILAGEKVASEVKQGMLAG